MISKLEKKISSFELSNMWLLVIGFVTHFVFFGSVFDIYFRTPIIHGMTPHSTSENPVANRIVLFVADGLRADTFYDFTNETSNAPFLRSIIELNGTWGVSHTRVPTESRPGHVAIIAGLYEDPSAIAYGWKENPVEFDSVFNESRHTWSWGSPDILPMFAAGSEEGHVETFMYSSSEEDFARNDASKLDTWVFDHVEAFFKDAKKNLPLRKKLNEDRIVFFLHLLGLDTNGHAHKPHSKTYKNNLKLVDEGVKRMTEIFEDFYGDGKTAYLFTSDHGMTDWGSHGSGDASETETPIVMWGSGISPPQDPAKFKTRMLYDPRTEIWGLNHVRRHDVTQTDIAPLMSSVIGIPIPVNSMGVLPVEYIDSDEKYRAQALFTNAMQMLAQYRQKRNEKVEDTLSILYKPFSRLSPDREVEMISQIRLLIKTEKYEESIEVSSKLISLCLDGLKYYYDYDRFALSLSITLGFIGWMVLLVCQVLWEHSAVIRIAGDTVEGRRVRRKSIYMGGAIIIWGLVTFILLVAQRAVWQHYLYFLTPVFLWWLVFLRLESLRVAWLIVSSFNMVWEVAIRCLVIIVGVEILVFSFFLRPLLSIGLISLAAWPAVLYSLKGTAEKSLRLGWLGACILLASFTYMPVVGKEALYPMVEVAGIAAFLLIAIGIFWCGGENLTLSNISAVACVQGFMLLGSVYIVHSTAFSIKNSEGLPVENQIGSWIILLTSLLIPLFSSHTIMGRLVSVASALLCPFMLLSIRHEVFFYISLTVAMFLWLILEFYLSGPTVQIASLKYAGWKSPANTREEIVRLIEWPDIRRAYFFLFFIILAFFGIGNIASVNSFDPTFVYCFVTVFSPFVMGGLLLLKIVIPFLLVTCFFHAICTLIEVPTRALFYIFLVLSDMMALHFFFLIRTEGSWLDIGTSLSHYVISMATTLFIILLMTIAKFITTFNLNIFRKTSEADEPVLPRIQILRPHRD